MSYQTDVAEQKKIELIICCVSMIISIGFMIPAIMMHSPGLMAASGLFSCIAMAMWIAQFMG